MKQGCLNALIAYVLVLFAFIGGGYLALAFKPGPTVGYYFAAMVVAGIPYYLFARQQGISLRVDFLVVGSVLAVLAEEFLPPGQIAELNNGTKGAIFILLGNVIVVVVDWSRWLLMRLHAQLVGEAGDYNANGKYDL